nr:SRP72 RNA-binding domain-containing protein [Tanacetum cinerariifolium]
MYYRQLEQILEFLYLSFKTVLFRVKWFDTSNKGHVDAPPDIIDVVDKDGDFIDEEDPIPHDLVDSDDEDLVNLDIDDGVNVVYSSEEED